MALSAPIETSYQQSTRSEQSFQFSHGVHGVRRCAGLDNLAANERIVGVKLAFQRIVTIFTEHDDVAQTMPTANLQSQQRFCRHSGFDHKFGTRLQTPADLLQKLPICLAVHITETVSETESAVKVFFEADGPHVCPEAVEAHTVLIRRLLGLGDEFAGQIHRSHRISSFGEFDRMASISARYV